MTGTAARVYTRRDDLDRLTALCTQLHEEERVLLTLSDGRRVSGVVLARPGLQTFLDGRGEEGMNALLKLDDVDGTGLSRAYWLDEVAAVEREPQDTP